MKLPQSYDTVTEAVNDLQKKGFTTNFSVLAKEECLVCRKSSLQLAPEEFQIEEIYRFEGDTDPGDEMIVMAISSPKYRVKGLVVNGFGAQRIPKLRRSQNLSKSTKPAAMNIAEELLLFFKEPKGEMKNDSPEGLCPVCWGYQQYEGKIREFIKDKQIEVNNHKDSYMIIQEFAKKHLEGIKLKEGELSYCLTCSCGDHSDKK